MTRQILIVIVPLALLLSGCAQSMKGNNPIIQLQAGHVVIENMQVGQPYTDSSQAQMKVQSEDISKLTSPVAVQAGAEERVAVSDADSLPALLVSESIGAAAEVAEQEKPTVIEEVVPEPSVFPRDGSVQESIEKQDKGQSDQDSSADGFFGGDNTAGLDDEVEQGVLSAEPQDMDPSSRDSSRDGFFAAYTTASWGAKIEHSALSAEQKIADGWHWFTAKVEDYRYKSTDWWMRRRGLDPELMR